MAADVSQGDPIRETIQGVCQKLQSTGDDCLFLSVTDKGTACCTLGTKNSLLFMRTQPQLAEEFRKFCSDLYSTVTVAVKEEGLDDADSSLTCDEGSSKEVDTKVSAATPEEPEGRSRPKRKMCTPSKLKLYETNFRKSNENGKTSKPIEKLVGSVKESNIKTGRKITVVDKSEEKESPWKKMKSVISSGVNKNLETPSAGKQKSEIPSNKKVENSASTKKMSETTRGKSTSKLDQSETVSLKDLTDEDDIDEYNDDDNDDDYVADNDYSPSARLPSKKVSISKKEDMDSTTQSLKYKCERCSLDFRRRSTLNRHLKNKICSRVKRNGKKVELVKQSHTSLVSQKGLLDSQDDGTKPKKLKCTTDMKLEVAEDGGEEETEDISVVSIETNSEDVVKNNKVTDEVHIIKIKEEKEDSDEESWDTSRTTKTKQRVKVPTPCKSCNVVFSSKYTLRRHMMHGLCPGIKLDIKSTITGGQEVLSCDICPKTFLSSIAFLRHYQRHKLGPSSAFICNICKSEFCHDWERVNHLVRHHKVNGPIDCQVCKHSYQNYDDYRTHRRFCKTTLKCEGEATLKITTTSGDKENIFVRNMQNNNSVSDEISDSDNRRHASSQGGIIQVNSDNHKQDVIEPDSVRVKLSCGTVAFFKESMIKKSFVADKNGSTNTQKDNIPSDTINSTGEAPSSERIMESSEQTADLVQDKVKSTENISC
ncbi:zinc finger protein 37-like [Argopecten irradians]|uniref:zinc finger protein 37-like n=1 Tax=Argopecten irradians TaxID=31199 RepID=UPI0037136A69